MKGIMLNIIIGMSLFFVALAFLVTENNAKYLLAGYNTMNEENRKKVNIKAYMQFFRRFHIFLGISILIIGLIVQYFFSEMIIGVTLSLYPILAYVYFVWRGSKIGNL